MWSLKNYSLFIDITSEESIENAIELVKEYFGKIDGLVNKTVLNDILISYYLDKYGFENPVQSQEIKDKIKQTNLDKYGVEYPLQSQEIRDIIKQTCLDKYGVEHTFQVKEFQNKLF